MRKVFLHISAISAALLMCLACSGDKVSLIPRGKLAKIYAEMLVVDQWTQSEPFLRAQADTSLVYEPIFEKYGYDTEDYIHSVEHYMKDPERYSRILRATADMLDKRILELNDLKKALKRQAEIESFVTDFNIGEFYPYLSEEPYVHYYDSLTVEPDSFSFYRIVPIERADTLYDLLRMIICKDTTAVDSLVVEAIAAETVKKSEAKEKAAAKGKATDEKKAEGTKLRDNAELLMVDVENMARKPLKLNDANAVLRQTKLDTVKLK